MRKLATALLIVLIIPVIILAQERINGPQSGTLGPGIFIVNGDVSVLSGESLTILAGTEFLHDGNHTWLINGQMIADGTETDSIYFTRLDTIEEHRWGGMNFHNCTGNNNLLVYCVIENSFKDPGSILWGGAVNAYYSDITISNSRISNCTTWGDGGAVYAYEADIIISDCQVVDNIADDDNTGGGIYLRECSTAEITDCIIAGNVDTGT